MTQSPIGLYYKCNKVCYTLTGQKSWDRNHLPVHMDTFSQKVTIITTHSEKTGQWVVMPYLIEKKQKRQIGWFPANTVKLLRPSNLSKNTPTEPTPSNLPTASAGKIKWWPSKFQNLYVLGLHDILIKHRYRHVCICNSHIAGRAIKSNTYIRAGVQTIHPPGCQRALQTSRSDLLKLLRANLCPILLWAPALFSSCSIYGKSCFFLFN